MEPKYSTRWKDAKALSGMPEWMHTGSDMTGPECCDKKMVRVYRQGFITGKRRWIPVGWYCKVCGTLKTN
jgi:rubredoxin